MHFIFYNFKLVKRKILILLELDEYGLDLKKLVIDHLYDWYIRKVISLYGRYLIKKLAYQIKISNVLYVYDHPLIDHGSVIENLIIF